MAMTEVQFQLRDGEILSAEDAKHIVFGFVSDEGARHVIIDGAVAGFMDAADLAAAIQDGDIFKVECFDIGVCLVLQGAADCSIVVDGLRRAMDHRGRWFAIHKDGRV